LENKEIKWSSETIQKRACPVHVNFKAGAYPKSQRVGTKILNEL
jgi:hypothetical protein